ncbi:MAG: EAL domain-containing protein [Lachnospiraceae bacterium]|nr:EAL domain-containing protein [Lachnospiraceae bacterium]
MGLQIYFDNYTPVGDILVMAISLVIFVLLSASYVNRTKVFGVYLSIVVFTFFAALTNMAYHNIFPFIKDGNYSVIYGLRMVYHATLFAILLLYVIYVTEVMRLESDKKRLTVSVGFGLFFVVIIADVVSSLMGDGFRVNESGVAINGKNIFTYGYLSFIILIIALLMIYRKRIYKRVMMGFYGTMAISFLLLYVQGRFGNTSFTVGTFLLPSIAMLYLIHSNPYDLEIGSINSKGLEDTVSYYYEKGIPMIVVSLYLPDFEVDGKKLSKELQETIRKFASAYFRGCVLFQISNGHVIFIAKRSLNADYKQKLKAMIEAFHLEYEKFRYDYKIIVGDSVEKISRKNEYVRFIKNIQQHMKMNDIHVIKEKDVSEYEEYENLLDELNDICKKGDLKDKRVLAYCQPVYNLKEEKYDTAEALMRLDVPKRGIIYPEQFIPIAEENGLIHGLTKIMLYKTCEEIGKLIHEGYEVNRVSVNVSITEMHDLSFVDDVFAIIRDSSVPDDKIAIEITESQTEHDFVVVKNKINELRERGIRIYLDDFGTGYSNVERILELPFDIIKFDKSLVVASEGDERSEKMVGSLACMFSSLDFSVLYEGVETEGDEKRCTDMCASYLQGYKYSRPIPISELRNYFTKRAWK